MTDLILRGRRLGSVFELLGSRENHITYSLGWALAHSPHLRRRVLAQVLPDAAEAVVGSVLLQHHDAPGGYTDVELVGPGLHVILEAKRGWAVPDAAQLALYAGRP
jgi:hypothetical protein